MGPERAREPGGGGGSAAVGLHLPRQLLGSEPGLRQGRSWGAEGVEGVAWLPAAAAVEMRPGTTSDSCRARSRAAAGQGRSRRPGLRMYAGVQWGLQRGLGCSGAWWPGGGEHQQGGPAATAGWAPPPAAAALGAGLWGFQWWQRRGQER